MGFKKLSLFQPNLHLPATPLQVDGGHFYLDLILLWFLYLFQLQGVLPESFELRCPKSELRAYEHES